MYTYACFDTNIVIYLLTETGDAGSSPHVAR